MKKSILKFVLPALVFGVVNFGGTSASAETVEVPTDIKSVISTNFEQPEIDYNNTPMPRPRPPRKPYRPDDKISYPPDWRTDWRTEWRKRKRPNPRPRRAVEYIEVNGLFSINDNVMMSDTAQS